MSLKIIDIKIKGYESFNSLKTAYTSLNNIGFEGINVYNE